jgi:extracellular elastinolytic metalloproteinase
MSLKNIFQYLLFLFLFQTPTLMFAQQQSPLDIALRYIEQNREDLQLTNEDIRHYQVNDLYTSLHNGVTHIYLNQEHENIKVLNAIININILPDGQVLNIGNRFISSLQNKTNGSNPSITPAAALQKVIEKFDIKTNKQIRLQSQISDQHFVFDQTGIALDPISVKLVYQEMDDKSVQLAWMVQLYQLDAQHWWNARIDAHSGELIAHHDQVIHCSFDKPDENCSASGHDHHFLKNTKSRSNITNQAFEINSYNVYPIPVQSPNHGDRALISSPSNAVASPFGWHDTDGANGPEFTITRGNNVHAYHDIFSINASSGDEPDGGASLDFDYPLDLSTALPYTQVDPAVTNLFYWNNAIHDIWYQYGFDEVSGNFQENNYGNGGIAGDYVRAEALDGGGTNNANFGTGEDGSGARMQMYIWTDDPLPGGGGVELIVTDPLDVAGNYEMIQAGFGGNLPNPAIVSEVVLVNDTIGIGSDACEDIVNGTDISGKIAMIDRGDCQFGVKVLKAENEGAIAVIICNNVPGGAQGMGPGTDGNLVTIPSAMVSLEDCNILKTALPGLTVEFGQGDVDIPMPGPSGLDGDLDNGIIVHEYTHGISIRLTGGPSTGGCLSSPEQAGEGWSDWFALVMTTNETNTADEPRGMGTYAIDEPTNGTGIREYPYSRDMTIDQHTYGDVPNVVAPHGVGSVWCVMIWDLYWNMIDEYGFDNDIYNGTSGNNMAMQLVLDGLKLQACSPSFIDSRDAILAADEANYNGVNKCLIWETFARRGLGWSASAGGNEAFDTPPFCTPVQVIKTAVGEILAGETITYSLEILNNLPSLISDIEITDAFPTGTSYVEGSLSCPNATVDNGVLTIDIGDLATGESLTCTYQLVVDAAPFSYTELEDDVEGGEDNWTVSSAVGAANWEVNDNSYEGDFSWFAEDIESECDQYLELAVPINLEGDNPSLVFWHWYDTEASWDGGVVEVSTDGGGSWGDLGNDMVQNGYNGTLQVNPASPISGQAAFNGNSGGFIQTVIDLSNYNDNDLLVRFRLGCDGAVGGNGWYIDNIQFYGDFYSITNTACVTSNGNDEFCDETTTVVFEGDILATNNIGEDLKISISPNPTDGVFVLHMNSTNNSSTTIQVMSVDGRLLQSTIFDRSSGAFEFDLSEYQVGVYLLQIQTDHTQVTRKVVIQ